MNLAPFAIALAGAFTLTACHDDHYYSSSYHRHGYYESRPSTVVVARTGPRYGYGYGYGGSSYRRNTTVVNNNTVVRNRNTVVRNTSVKRNNNQTVVVNKKKKHHDHD